MHMCCNSLVLDCLDA